MKQILTVLTLGVALLENSILQASAQTVEKVADLTYETDENDVYHGGTSPVQRFAQVGTDLWFTTQTGGTNNLGTISRFDLNTHEVVQVANLVTNTGYSPLSELLVIGTDGYFTTTAGGTDGRGTLAKIDLVTGSVTALFSLPGSLAYGLIPQGRITPIGGDLWVVATAGGVANANHGVIFKYSLADSTATVVTNLFGSATGGNSFGGLTPAGSDWYFTTLLGGSTWATTNYPIIELPDGSTKVVTNRLQTGAGTLGKLTIDSSGNAAISTVANLQGGYGQTPSAAPILVGTNSLYFTTVGILSPNVAPGAIVRYDLDTGFLTNLFIFSTNPIPAAAYGIRPGYASPTEWLGELYIVNRQGGANAPNLNAGGGTVIKYNIAANTVTKLADLSSATSASSLGSPGGTGITAFGSGLVVQETNRFYIYQPLPKGGAFNFGTIIRIALPPQPIVIRSITKDANGINLSWSGGYPPFDIVTNADFTLNANWAVQHSGVTSGVNTTNWSVTLPVPDGNLYYRVRGQSQ